MQQQNRGDVIAELIDISIHTQITTGKDFTDGISLEFEDYDASESASVRFDYEKGEPTMAAICFKGDSSEVNFWLSEDDSQELSEFFEELAEDLRQVKE